MRGVNLGGWLILEKWMTPGVFAGADAIDEYTFMQTRGAREKLRAHQREFVREEDFAWMRANGVDAIRIPVGYWVFDGDDPYVPCIGRLDWAFRMAEKYNLQVLVSMHGAPGSQNGHDHSGRVGRAEWYDRAQHRQRTRDVLLRLAERYRDSPVFWGLQLLNEPRTRILNITLRRFYRQTRRELALVLSPSTRIVFSDAFTPRLMNGALWPHRATMDIHWYHFVFATNKYVPLSWYYLLVRTHGWLLWCLRLVQPVIVGEWNGIIGGSVLDKYPREQHDDIIAEHTARQLAAYRHADAWFYWSYKTEARGVWHFRSQVEDGLLRF